MKRMILVYLFLSSFVPVLAQIAPVPPITDDWPMGFHDAAHSGKSAETITLPLTLDWTWHNTNVHDNDPKWGSPLPGRFSLPIVYQSKVMIQGNLNSDRMFTLDPNNGGKEIWEIGQGGYADVSNYLFQFDAYPAAINGRVIMSQTDWYASFDANTGLTDPGHTTVWNAGGWPMGGVAIGGTSAFIQWNGSDDFSETYSIQPTATTTWQSLFISTPHLTVYPSVNPGYAYQYAMLIPALGDGQMYVNLAGQLLAVNQTTNVVVWRFGQNCGGGFAGMGANIPAFWNHMVIFGCQDVLYAFDSTSGTKKWSLPLTGSLSPIVADGVVYVGSTDINLYAVDATAGTVKWKFTTGQPFSGLQIPAISANTIFVPSMDGNLYALDIRTGTQLWKYPSPNGVAWGPVAISGGRVYSSTLDPAFTFYSFKSTGPPPRKPFVCPPNAACMTLFP